MRRSSFWTVLLMGLALLLVPASPASAAPYCGFVWGSLDKAAPGLSVAPVTNVRTGRHTCYDRLVIDLAGPGTFEGYTTVGLGVRARLPFRVFELAGPGTGSRLVVDVAHRW